MMLKNVIRQIQDNVLPHIPAGFEVVKLLDAQTLRDLLNGKVTIPDQVVNKYLAATSSVTEGQELRVYAKSGNLVAIFKEIPQWGTIRLIASVTEVIHDNEQSTITLQLIEKELLGKRFASWVLSMCKLSWLTKLFGIPNFGKGIAVSVAGDCITVDFKKRLNATKLATMKIQDKSVLNMVQVIGGESIDGQFVLDVCLD